MNGRETSTGWIWSFATAVWLTVFGCATAQAGNLVVPIEESCPADQDEVGGPIQLPCTTFLRAELSGAAERPGPGDPDGVGRAIFAADDCANRLCVTYSVSNIDGTASGVHLHFAPPDAPGPVVVPFAVPTLTNANVTVSECVDVANEELLHNIILNPEQYYFNFHSTPDFPAGAVRGQLRHLN